MAHTGQSCYDIGQLRQLVSERISEADEAAIVEHLTSCEDCQRALEHAAAGGGIWNHLHELLRTDETTDLDERDSEASYRSVIEHLSPTDDPQMIGRIGPYEVCGIVGQGSTGVVVKAFEARLNRYVAIKILSPSLANNTSARRRFEREARAVAAVSDEHVIPIFAVDENRGLPYLVMQYVAGESLDRRIENQGALSSIEVVRVGMQVARGLAAAHAQGIVHRDVKPANVMMERGIDRAMVTDFGMARVTDEASMTRSGVISGTPQFMSPEQAKGESIDPRSDLFSLGSLMYMACTGRPPFQAETVYGVIQRVCEVEPRPIREFSPEVPFWLEAFIAKLCSKRREDRFDSAAEVSSLLSAELAHMQSPTIVREPARPWMPRTKTVRWQPAVASFVALLVLVVGGIGLGQLAADREDEARLSPVSTANQTAAITGPTQKLDQETWDKRPVFESVVTQVLSTEPGGKLTVQASSANVEIAASDSNEVRLEVIREVICEDVDSADEFLQNHQLDIRLVEDGVQVTSEIPEQRNKSEGPKYRKITMKVTVPQEYRLDLNTTGNIAIDRVVGAVSAKTKGGNVVAKHVGPLDVFTAGGNITVSSVSGAANAKSGGGNIHFDEIGGDVDAQTAGGNITLGWVAGNAKAVTNAGNVLGVITKQPSKDCELITKAGNVTLKIGKEIRCNLDAGTKIGNVHWPRSQGKAKKQVRAPLNGGGPEMKVQTMTGNVNIDFLSEDKDKQAQFQNDLNCQGSIACADNQCSPRSADAIESHVQAKLSGRMKEIQSHADSLEKAIRLEVENALLEVKKESNPFQNQ